MKTLCFKQASVKCGQAFECYCLHSSLLDLSSGVPVAALFWWLFIAIFRAITLRHSLLYSFSSGPHLQMIWTIADFFLAWLQVACIIWFPDMHKLPLEHEIGHRQTDTAMYAALPGRKQALLVRIIIDGSLYMYTHVSVLVVRMQLRCCIAAPRPNATTR